MGISRLYSAGTPFNDVDLFGIDFEQTADVMYFAHLNYAPTKLTRGGHTDWTFATITFGPTITAPGSVAATPSGSTADPGYHATDYNYVVTAIDDELNQESRASTSANATNDLTLDGHYNTITWAAVTGADRYAIYKNDNDPSGSYGYIGTTTGTSFIDRNIAGDMADTPPIGQNPFAADGDYPSTVTFFEQRLMWGRTKNKPNAIFGSQSADFENMDTSRPAKADDALTFGLVSSRVNAVNQLVSMKNLLALTTDAVFMISGGGADIPLTPSQIVSRRQSGRGSTRLNPIIVDSVCFFQPNQGSSIRTLGYTFELDGYQSNNVAIFSPHFFEGFVIKSWAFQQEPYACVWAVRSDGKLLCFTWEQEQQVWGWTMCEMNGVVEDVCTITENGMDRLYLAVRRTLAGQEDVFIERMALPVLVAGDLVNSCYLDCAVSQNFDPAQTVVGQLWHLEGEQVTAFHDGYVTTGLTVTNGAITLPSAASVVTVGIPYSGEIETLPLALSTSSGTLHTMRQMMATAVIRVEKTRGIKAGAGDGTLFEIKQRQSEEIGDPISLKTGDFIVQLGAKWNNGATVRIVQDYPLPATISGIFPEVIPTG